MPYRRNDRRNVKKRADALEALRKEIAEKQKTSRWVTKSGA